MSLEHKFLLVPLLIFVVQKSFCPDEGHFIVVRQRYGRHDEVRARIDMPHSSKADVVDVLERYFSYSRGEHHPFSMAIKTAQQIRNRNLQNNSHNNIIETEGLVRASNDHMVPFKVFYGFNSGQEAVADARGRQIEPSEIKQF